MSSMNLIQKSESDCQLPSSVSETEEKLCQHLLQSLQPIKKAEIE